MKTSVVLEVKRGTGERRKYLYATLHNFSSGALLVSADLGYCLRACTENNYEILNAVQAFEDVNRILNELLA